VTQTVLLVFARSAGLVFRAPGFSHPNVPAPVRAGFALALAFAIAPHVRAGGALDGAAFAIAITGETLLGATIGVGASLLYDGAYYAGRFVDDYVGVRASVPTANVTSAQAFGRLWSSVFLAGFFLLDGYVPVVNAFAESFDRIPAGVLVTHDALMHVAFALPATIVRAALAIAAPAIAVVLTVQIALGAVARVVPRFASFSLAFPVVFAAALLATIAGVPLLAPLAAHPWLVLPWSANP
jgi:flagellar biosynthetic protein FliR